MAEFLCFIRGNKDMTNFEIFILNITIVVAWCANNLNPVKNLLTRKKPPYACQMYQLRGIMLREMTALMSLLNMKLLIKNALHDKY